MDQPDAVIGEVGQLDDSGPRVCRQAVRDMLAVLAVLISSGCEDRVGHRGHEFRDPLAVGCGQQCESARPPGRGQILGVVLDGVVEQSGADHCWLLDAVVDHDPECHAEQMVDVRLALTAIGGVQLGREPQCPRHLSPGTRVDEPGRLQCEPLP